MRRKDVLDDYFEWLYDIVSEGKPTHTTFRKLLSYLHDIDFTWTIEMDENRANNGIELRRRFVLDHNRARYVEECLDKPCSVLEMMIALSFKMEHIMDNPQIGDRTSQWFWQMIVNMGLGGMSDDNYNEIHVMWTVDRFLNRDYERDGSGGLFVIRDINRDLRDVEIWNQMCWYLDRIAK